MNNSTPEEKFAQVQKLSATVEENFFTLGELLSDIKRTKLYQFRGYNTFKEFVESEYGLGGALANKLVSIYELYVGELDLDEATISNIGLERLSIIKSLVKAGDWGVREEWVKKAEDTPVRDLRDLVKAEKPEPELNLKQVFAKQNQERLLALFNCSSKELNYKYALYFQGIDDDHIRKAVKERQRKFEEELASAGAQDPVPQDV